MKRFFARLWHSPTFTTWGSFSVSFLALLLITPLVLTRFSTEVLAVWFLFAVLIGFIQLADFGFTPTFVRLTAFTMGGATDLRDFRDSKKKGSGKPNWEVMEKLYGNMGYIYIFSTVFVFFLASILGTRILEKPISYTNNVEELYSAWYIIIAGLTLSFYGRKYQAILQGMNYIALVNRINIFFGLIGVGASFLVLMLDGTILQLVIVQQFFSVLGAIRGWLILRNIEQKRFREFKVFSFDKQIFEAAWRPAWRNAIVILGSTGVIQATGIIYSQIGDASSLAIYLFSLKLINISSDISKAPFYSKMPLFARLRAEGRLEDLTRLSARAMFISLSIFIILTVSMMIFAPVLLSFIKSNVPFIDYRIWILMIIVWLLERHHGMHAQIYMTTNKVPFYIPVLITGSITIFLSLIFVKSFGIWTFPVVQGISNLLFNNWWNVKVSLQSINKTFFQYYRIMLQEILKLKL